MTVNIKVNKIFPAGFLPGKAHDYHQGELLYIPPLQGIYQAVYIPENHSELKAINIAFSAYNLEDRYDVYVGDNKVISNSPVIEMAEIAQLELYTNVSAGTPIVVDFHNHSATAKYMFCKFITITDVVPKRTFDQFNWYETWNGYHVNINQNGEYDLVLATPSYHNVNSEISNIKILVKELVGTHKRIAEILWDGTSITSDYVETDPTFKPYDPLARSENVIIPMSQMAITKNTIRIKFKLINTSGSIWDTTGRINMTMTITVTNKIV